MKVVNLEQLSKMPEDTIFWHGTAHIPGTLNLAGGFYRFDYGDRSGLNFSEARLVEVSESSFEDYMDACFAAENGNARVYANCGNSGGRADPEQDDVFTVLEPVDLLLLLKAVQRSIDCAMEGKTAHERLALEAEAQQEWDRQRS